MLRYCSVKEKLSDRMCTDKSMDILPECSSVSRRKMITKKEILDAIHGKMIISCQAVEDEPLYVEEKSIMYLMARAAKQAGTPAIRTSSIRDVIAIKEETGLPVIGLVKIQYPGYEGYITPTMKEVDDLVAAGSDVVALDCTPTISSLDINSEGTFIPCLFASSNFCFNVFLMIYSLYLIE